MAAGAVSPTLSFYLTDTGGLAFVAQWCGVPPAPLFPLEVATDLFRGARVCCLRPRAERAHLRVLAMGWWPWRGSPCLAAGRTAGKAPGSPAVGKKPSCSKANDPA